ncbi:type VI secretion system-associated protein TagF [Paraglaciecola sp.]|uniref:type VI secretion system-associated protein TagF n=1 Tax=Paraglaciecola sp. TaxID=1920173 RepID=UPI003EF2E522
MAVGFYGKVPTKGDFVQRHLDRKFTQHWDSWLQACMENSKAKLGDRWLQTYLVSPIWRFAFTKGIFSENNIVGVVIPSVDSVGRHFPFTLAAEVPEQINLYQFAIEQDKWFEKLEDLALSGLEQDFNLDVFESELAANPAPVIITPNKNMPATERRIGWQHGGINTYDLVISGLSTMTKDKMNDDCIWWTAGSDNIEPTFLNYAGLPPQDDFCNFLSGEWQHG